MYRTSWFLRWAVIVGFILFVVGCGSSDKSDIGSQVGGEQSQKVKYKVVAKKDVSFGVTKRFEFRVVVPSSADKAYLENVARDIIDHEIPLNAATFLFYDREEDSESIYTIGKAVWVPYGNWARASEVETGDYSKHQMIVEIKEKTPVLTSEEFAIHDEIKAMLKGPGNPYSENPPAGADIKEWMAKQSTKIAQWEDNAYKTVAKKHNITPQKAKEIYLKVEMR